MPTQTALYFDEKCLWHSAGTEFAGSMPVGDYIQPNASNGHPESPESKRRIKSLLDVSGMTAQLTVHSASPASRADLLRVHTSDYLDKLKAASDDRGGDAGDGAPFGRGGYEIAALSAGLVTRAVDDVLSGSYKNAFSLNRPPGHHCLANMGMGFCLLANIALAIEAAKAKHDIPKIAVVDWDVHHGNGTQAIFYDRADVLTISLHQEFCFPADSGAVSERGEGDGEGYNLNIPLLPGMGHNAYLYAFDRIVLPALEAYQPDLIIVASGLDANRFDPLARMQLHSDSYREMTKRIMIAAANLCNEQLVVVHEGGYSESYVPFCGLAIVEQLSGHRSDADDPFLDGAQTVQPNPRFDAFQRELIDEMAAELLG